MWAWCAWGPGLHAAPMRGRTLHVLTVPRWVWCFVSCVHSLPAILLHCLVVVIPCRSCTCWSLCYCICVCPCHILLFPLGFTAPVTWGGVFCWSRVVPRRPKPHASPLGGVCVPV